MTRKAAKTRETAKAVPAKGKKGERRRPSRTLTLLLLALLCLGVMVQLSALNREIDKALDERTAYSEHLADLQRTNARLTEDISRRDDPDLIEEIAREDLGMAAPGEKVFIIN